MLRIGNIPHLSAVPYKALEGLPFLTYEENFLTDNFVKLLKGDLDIALVSAVDVVCNPNFLILEFGMGCRSCSDSMIIYAKDPLEKLDTIHVYGFSQSSQALVKLLYRQQYNRDIRVVRHVDLEPLDCVGKNEGALSLHTLPDMQRTEFATRVDVATWWNKLYNKPFVFLVWALNKELRGHPDLPKLHRWFDRYTRVSGGIARDFATSYGTTAKAADIFIGDNRRYYLDDFLLGGLFEFFIKAHQHKLLESPGYRPVTRSIQEMNKETFSEIAVV